MKKVLNLLERKSRYGRILPYAILSALVAFIGVRGDDSSAKGRTLDLSNTKQGNFIPTAFADTPSDSGGDGTASGSCTAACSCGGCSSSCGGCGSGSAGCGASGDSGGCASSSGGCCFPASASIATPEGMKAIAELQVGDMVVSYNEMNGEFTTSKVSVVLKHSSEADDAHDFAKHPLMHLEYEVEGEKRKMFITANHPVLDAVSGAYKPIKEFAAGDSVMTRSGVTKLEFLQKLDITEEVVYNLTLSEGPATYIADGLVVHNKSDGGDCA